VDLTPPFRLAFILRAGPARRTIHAKRNRLTVNMLPRVHGQVVLGTAHNFRMHLLLARWATLVLALKDGLALQAVDDPARDAATLGTYLDCSWGAGDRSTYLKHQHLALSHWPCKDHPDFGKVNRQKTIVCVGDSITHGSHIENSNSTYPARLHHLLQEGFNVLNLGVSGTTAQRAGDEPYRKFPHWGVAQEIDFDAAIVQLGTNDAKTINWDPSTSPSKYRADLLEMLRQLAKRHPQAKFIMSVPPLVRPNNFSIQEDVVAKALPDAIQDVAHATGLSLNLIYMQAVFADARTPLQDLLLEDGVHPTEAGYKLMSVAVAAAVRRALSLPP